MQTPIASAPSVRIELAQQLIRRLEPLRAGSPVHVQVVGRPGCGKGQTTKAVLDGVAREWTVDFALVQCHPAMRVSGVVSSILRTFCPTYPTKGFSLTALTTDLRNLMQARNRNLLVMLDNLDVLADPERAVEGLQALSISIVATGQDQVGGLAVLEAKAPTRREKRAAMLARADQLGVQLASSVQNLLDEAPLADGLEALEALAGGRPKKSDARMALDAVANARLVARLDALSDHHLMILEALASQAGPMRSRRLRDAYTQQANAHHEKAVANVQFLKYVDQLRRVHVLDVAPMRGGSRGGALAVTLIGAEDAIRRAVQAAWLARAA